MDPLSIQASQLATSRPAAALPVELAAVLRQGQVLAGEVLQTFAGGSLLIGVGRHRIPARSQVELQAGQRFRFRVEEEADEVVLRVLDGEEEPEAPLRVALRRAPGWARPLGRALAELAEQIARSGDPPLRRLAAELTGHAVAEGADAAALRSLLARGGLLQEALLAEVMIAEARPEERPALRRALARTPHAGASTPPQAAPREPGRGPGVAASAAAPETAAPKEALLESLRCDLKTRLLAALAELPEGAPREAVARVLAALELEQLLNLARAGEGEPCSGTLLLLEGAALTPLHLRYEPPAGAADERSPHAEQVHRLTLAFDLRATGPLRIDLALRAQSLAVRVRVASEEAAARLRPRLRELQEALARGGRTVTAGLHVDEAERWPLDRVGGRWAEQTLMDRWA